jgi:hypothetical protein
MSRLFVAAALLVALSGAACGPTKVAASKDAVKAYAQQDLCGGAAAEVVYYGLRGEDVAADSACFGPTADKLAVVQCGEQRRAYWGFGDRWEPRPGEVTAVEPGRVEITLPSSGSGAVAAVARCGH